MAVVLRPIQVYRYILLPVSYRIIIPPLTSEFLCIFKNSSLALTIGVLVLTVFVVGALIGLLAGFGVRHLLRLVARRSH